MSPPEISYSLPPSSSKTSTRAVQRTQKTRECAVCHEEASESQFSKFSTCPTKPCNSTCKFCWTKHVKIQVIEHPLNAVSCFKCGHDLTQDIIKQRLNNQDRAHYEWKLARLQGTRVCSRVAAGDDRATRACHGTMAAPSTKPDSNIVICNTCNAQDCHTCNSPVHEGETCEARQSCMATEHGAEEAKTAAAFETGYSGSEEIGKLGKVDEKAKRPVKCPGCGIYCERKEKCPWIRCLCCGMEFCSRSECGVPYLGKGSVPELDNGAHAPSCAHSQRTRSDKRFKKTSQVKDSQAGDCDKAKVDGDKDSGVGSESKKRRNAAEGSEVTDADESEQPAKKRKRRPISNELIMDSDNEDEAEIRQVPPKRKRISNPRFNFPLSKAEQEEHDAKQAEKVVRRQNVIARKERRKGLTEKKRNLEENTKAAMIEWEKLFGSS